MANKDKPWGFRPKRPGSARKTEYTVTAAKTVYQGDLLKIVAAGTVEAATVDIGSACIGVASSYQTAGNKVLVYDDPATTFVVQSDTGTATTAADIGATANHVATAGNATTQQSKHELDSSDITTGGQLKILKLVDRIDNAWGEHSDLEVLISEHHYNTSGAGV